MDIVLSYLQDYWGLLLIIVAFCIYLVSIGRAEAKKVILSLMLRVEKDAEALLLKTGEEKLGFVVDRGYQLLPPVIRAFITFTMFQDLANKLYAEAKRYLLSLGTEDELKPKAQELQERKETDPG